MEANGDWEAPQLLPQMTFSSPRMYLAAGVTTMRTTESVENYADLNLKKMIDSGLVPRPHIDVTGPYLEGSNPYLFMQMHQLTNPRDARQLVDYWADQGVTLTLQGMGEVLALLGKGGLAPRVTFDVLTGSLFDGHVHKTYGGKIVEGRYTPPGMTTPLAVKDLRLALAEAENLAVPMPAASLVHDRLVATIARGWAELDWSALGLLAADDAGLHSTTGISSDRRPPLAQ